jgi:putative transposase
MLVRYGSLNLTKPEEAKSEIFVFIEKLYQPVKRHSHIGGVLPAKFEEAYFARLEGVC